MMNYFIMTKIGFADSTTFGPDCDQIIFDIMKTIATVSRNLS